MTDQHVLRTDPYGGVDPASMPPRLGTIPAFRDLMARGWGEASREPQLVPGAAEAAAAHRQRLAERLPDRTVVVAAGHAPTRVNDTAFAFRPDSDFAWLTNVSVEYAVLVMRGAAGSHTATLHIPAPARPGDTAFFGNAAYGELWVGPSPSLDEWSAALGVDVRPIEELPAAVEAAAEPLFAGPMEEQLAGREVSTLLRSELAELRMIKDPWEVDQLREAVRLTIGGFRSVVAELPVAIAGGGERWLQGTFDRHARTFGNDVGYATIVGSGPHAPTLHWVRCDGDVRHGDALLLDMGVEAKSLYTADVTRTIPVSGSFSSAQREIHDLVERAHLAGAAEVRPGNPWSAFHHAAMAVLAEGLADMGILGVSAQ